ncbi:MAG: DUF935 domain-containing protein [Prevotellaceae bacterium]|nr:DUF935 domain-containing protein [Prevotellaceae bacterium]
MRRAADIIKRLKVEGEYLAKSDNAKWRAAHQMALNVENPKRIGLYNLYNDTTVLDTHLSGVVERTKLGVKRRKFKITDDGSGKEDYEATKLFMAMWFWSFMDLALDAEYYGHSLIELGDAVTTEGKMGFTGVKLIPRNNVCPEYGVLLINQGDTPDQGVPYRNNRLSPWLVEAGGENGLGRYLKVTPHVISKKHVQIFWDNFAERFGIPIIYASTDTRNDSDRIKIENMLSSFGGNTWGYFPAGTNLSLIETAKGDAFEVFDRRIIRANREISIGLAGQTMAFEDGSSLSQSEVHERGFEEVKDAFATSLRFLINDQLLPKMRLHGFPLRGKSFEWDDSAEYTPEQTLQIERMLLDSYEIDPAYFSEKYNIPITGIRSAPPDPFG